MADVRQRTSRRAVEHDSLQPRVLRRSLQQDIGSRGQAQPSDSAAIDVLALRQEVERSADVRLPGPALRVRAALALPATSSVVEQDSVAVPREHRGVPPGAAAVPAASVDDHDRGSVLRRHVPPCEVEAVPRVQRDRLVGRRERGLRNRLARLPGLSDADCDRKADEQDQEDRDDRSQRPAADSPRPRPSSRPREHREHCSGDECGRSRDEEEAREIRSVGAVPPRIHDVHRRAGPCERHEDEPEQRADDRRQARVEDRDAGHGRRQGEHRPVIAYVRSGRRIEQRLVHEVQHDRGSGAAEENRLEAIHIRSGASTPTRLRLSAITICVARTSASRNSCASLSSTRCSW